MTENELAREGVIDIALYVQEELRHLGGSLLHSNDNKEKVSTRNESVNHVWWKRGLYHRIKNSSVVAVPMSDRFKTMYSLHDHLEQ